MPDTMTSLDTLLQQAEALHQPITAAVVATEEHVLEAALLAAKNGLIIPTLIGEKNAIQNLCSLHGCQFDMVETHSAEEAALAGVEEVRQGRAQMLIKGHLHTAEFLHPILKHLRHAQRLSHVFIGQLSHYPKLLFITDAVINIAPDLATKVDILNNAAKLANALGIERPKVAALSAIEDVNAAIPSTIDAACLAKMSDRGQLLAHLQIDGPLALDNAISPEAVRIKGIRSDVAGDADILLMPDLASGNILYKAMEYLTDARFAGIVLGASVPVVLTSRADGLQTRLASIALGRLAHALNVF